MRTAFLSALALAPLAVSAQKRTTWSQEARIKDPNAECKPYDYPPVDALMKSYPTIWATATLTSSAYDQQLYASISAGIPDIAPRGNRAGDFSAVKYNSSDPDCWWSWNKCTTPKLSGLEDDLINCPQPNTWGFTLDDGPNCSHNAYFDYLKAQEQKATLFYIGSNVIDWPLEAQRGLADGHEICSHTWSHPYMTAMTNEQAFAELYYSKKIIKDVLGITVRCWRAPYGDVDDRIRWIAAQLDMRTILWSEDTDDYNWAEVGIPQIDKNYQKIIDKSTAGSYATYGPIVLSHEIDGVTMNISQAMLPSLRKTFTGGVVPVGVCMNNTTPYVETANYVYPNYQQYMAGTVSVSVAAPTAVSKTVNIPLTGGNSSAGVAAASATYSAASAARNGATTSLGAAESPSSSSKSATPTATKTGDARRSSSNVFVALGLGAVTCGLASLL